MKRKPITKRGSKRLFRKTAEKIHPANAKVDSVYRGGIRL